MQVGSTLPMMSQIKFGAKDTLVQLNDVPALIGLKKNHYQAGSESRADTLFGDGQIALELWEEILENGPNRLGESQQSKLDSEDKIEEETVKLKNLAIKNINALKIALEKLQGIVNS